MPNNISWWSSALAALCLGAISAWAAAGHYEGTMQASGQELKMKVDLMQKSDGWAGWVTLEPGPRDIALQNIAIAGESVRFEVSGAQIPAVFSGKWDQAAGTLAGSIKQGDREMPVHLKRTGEAKAPEVVQSTAIAAEYVGRWEGTLATGQQNLRLALELANDSGSGRAAGTLTSIDQGNARMPVTSVVQKGDEIIVEVRTIGGTLRGKLNDGKTELTAEWTQGMTFPPFVMRKAGATAAGEGKPDKR